MLCRIQGRIMYDFRVRDNAYSEQWATSGKEIADAWLFNKACMSAAPDKLSERFFGTPQYLIRIQSTIEHHHRSNDIC